MMLAAMTSFREGDFSARLPNTWPGMDGRIAEVFNQTITQKQRLAAHVTRLSLSVGKEGRLNERIMLSSAGGWAEEIYSINTLVEDLVRHEFPHRWFDPACVFDFSQIGPEGGLSRGVGLLLRSLPLLPAPRFQLLACPQRVTVLVAHVA